MKKFLLLVLLSSFAFLDSYSRALPGKEKDSVNGLVVQCVSAYMNPFFEKIPDEHLENYGIRDRSEISKITLGKPVEVYYIVNHALTFSNSWRVPVIIDDEYRALFTVVMNKNGDFQTVDFGAEVLAREIFNERKSNDPEGILRIFELQKDFFIFTSGNGESLFKPLPDAGKQFYTLNDILGMIK